MHGVASSASLARTFVACALAVAGLTACGGCPQSSGEGGGGGSASTGSGGEGNPEGTTATGEHTVVDSQSPGAHETPEHDLVFDDHALSAAPSDAPPERLTQEMISHIVTGQTADIIQCYELALHRDASAAGRVVLRMHISASGNVVSTEVADNTVGDDEVGTCIAEHAQHWHFPESQHDIAVTYPFQLSPSAS